MKKELISSAFTHFFHNKVVVISGGAGGLGQALMRKIYSSGAKVALLDIQFPVEPLDIDSSSQSNILQLECDICQIDQVNAAIKKIMEVWGAIDVLINNAGIAHMSRFEDTQLSLVAKIMDVNFMGSVNMTQSCLPYLQESKGQIVAISSVAGFSPLYGRTAYAASKHAMEGFFTSLAAEQKERGVTVSIVCPSFVSTRPELSVAVNQGISSPGAPKKHQIGGSLSPERAAHAICKTIVKKNNKLYLGTISKVAKILHTFLPKFYSAKMLKAAQKEFK